jgi:hypothetical protein
MSTTPTDQTPNSSANASQSNSETTSKVISFTAYKNKETINNEFSHSRKPLYVNSDDGRISGNPVVASKGAQEGDLGDRLHKIRSSLDRINTLMADLKKLSAHREKEKIN